MSTEGRSTEATLATADLESASFVRLVTRPDGDALAACGVIADALAEREIPFQVSAVRTVGERTTLTEDSQDRPQTDQTLVVGTVDGDVSRIDPSDRPATLEACELARELGSTPDPVLALAGVVAAGVDPGAGETEWLLEAALERNLLEERPGVAVPTADPIDGLAHSTRVRAPWSGDPEATREAFSALVPAEGIDSETSASREIHRKIGSLVAIDAVGMPEATDGASNAIARALSPYAATNASPDVPESTRHTVPVFETIGGYADVLEATARVEPGTGIALALGHDARDPALDAWRDHGRVAHAALGAGSTERYNGIVVVNIDDGPVETVARLTAAYRSPEPLVLAVGDGETGVATTDARPLGSTLEAITRELDGEGIGCGYDVGRRRGYLTYDSDADESTIIAAVRGQI
ncbi:exonuclease [Halostagnicola sp. A-GB9-2]|uniref:exonuclease n=1 Tax=Halostagnicola sp. A-GB9-2 TaxID=3048066 RepID=UPI0024C0B4DB|nr:exonuclease [Halostagnicola sp. A-GB9-2]MDJ1430681.1 exonuclease [Halostagnicola sp. A-GB9-2]